MIDENGLYELAGPKSFDRGVSYFHDDRVALTVSDKSGFQARAEGMARYRLWLRDNADGLLWDCDCPMAADGNFCKHLVAAGLAWLEDAETGKPGAAEDTLLATLKREPAERLAGWLHEAAQDDPALARRLRLQLSDDPKERKKALGKMLNTGGFLDFRRSLEYAAQLDTPLAMLSNLLERDPAECYALTEYALSRLLRIYERADDSAGAIGSAIQDFADLHARAAPATERSGAQFAGALFKLKQKDEWDLFPLERYWETLGDKGRAAYARRVHKEYDELPARSPNASRDNSRRLAEFAIARRREELARVEGDLDDLIKVLRRDLSSGLAYQKIVHACREHGRDAQAMQWAERGLKAHPQWGGMRVLAAEEYQKAGLDDEARDLLWQHFVAHPGPQSWQQLRQATDDDQWPALREQALTALAEREPRTPDGRSDASLRIDLLREDGDTESARDLANAHAASPRLLRNLAEDIAEAHPRDASAFLRRTVDAELARADAKTYANIVPWIRRAIDLDSGAEAGRWLAAIRDRYSRKRKLMGLMDEAGLA